MTQPPNDTPDLPEEAIGGVPVEAPTAGDGGADVPLVTVARTVLPVTVLPVTVAPTAEPE